MECDYSKLLLIQTLWRTKAGHYTQFLLWILHTCCLHMTTNEEHEYYIHTLTQRAEFYSLAVWIGPFKCSLSWIYQAWLERLCVVLHHKLISRMLNSESFQSIKHQHCLFQHFLGYMMSKTFLKTYDFHNSSKIVNTDAIVWLKWSLKKYYNSQDWSYNSTHKRKSCERHFNMW